MIRVFPRNRRSESRNGTRVMRGTAWVGVISLIAGLSSIFVVSGVASAHDVVSTTIYTGATPACTASGATDNTPGFVGPIYTSCTESGGSAITGSTTLPAPATVFDTAYVHNMGTPTTVELTYDLFQGTPTTCGVSSGISGFPDLPYSAPYQRKYVYANPSSSFPYTSKNVNGYNVPYGTSVSPAFTGLAAGSYYIIAYTDWNVPSLIGNVGGSTSQLYAPITCEPFTVGAATPSILTTPSVSGTSAHDSATVSGTSGTPTGTVTFNLYKTSSSSPSSGGSLVYTSSAVTLSGGTATSPTDSGLAPGYYYWVDSYSGSGTYSPIASSSAEPFSIATSTPTLNLTPSSPSCSTASVSATVSGSSGTPTGTVTFSLYNSSNVLVTTYAAVTLSGGSASLSSSTIGTLAAGNYSFKATYSGDSNYSSLTGSSSTFVVASCSATVSTTPSVSGTSATDTVTVTGSSTTPSGSVTFTLYKGNYPGTQTGYSYTTALSGSGSTTTATSTSATSLAPGSYYFVATYNGNGTYSAVTGSPEPLTISTSPSHETVTATSSCSSTNVSATVTGSGVTPTGTVTFLLYNSSFVLQTTYPAVTLSGGVATLPTLTSLSAGNYYFFANYSGDSNYSGYSAVSSLFTVSSCSVSLSTSPSVSGTTATDTATVTGSSVTPSGSVTFTLWSGTYPGTQITSYSDTVALSGSGSTLTASSISTASLAPGNYYFIATYNGNLDYGALVGSPEPFTIATATSHVSVSPTSSCSATNVSATVTGSSGTPTGTVTFSLYNSANVLQTTYPAVTLSGGTAILPTTGALAAGNYYFSAAYSGDSNYSPSTGTGTFTAAACTVSVSTSPTVSSTSAIDTASVTGSPVTPSGYVTFTLWSGTYPGTQISGYSDTVALSGSGTTLTASSISTGTLAPGNYYFVATFNGDSNYPVVTGSPEPFSIAAAVSHVSVTPTSSCSLTSVSATVTGSSGTPTGTVVFSLYNSANVLQTTYTSVTLSNTGVATLSSSTIGSLPTGSYYFVATYSGNGNYSSSTGTGSFNVAACTVTVSTTPSISGLSATDKVTVTGSSMTPTGTVSFTLWSGTYPGTQVVGYTDTETLAGSAGVATATTQTSTGNLAPGSYYFVARYNGDTNYPAVTGSPEPFTIATATPHVAVSATSSCSSTGVTATVTGSLGTPTGSVVFSLYNSANVLQYTYPAVTLSNTGVATLPSATIPTGSYYFLATYSGDSNYSSASGTGSFTVTACTVSLSTVPSVSGTSATDTATVTGSPVTPTGTVTFTLWSGTYPGTQVTGYSDVVTLAGNGSTIAVTSTTTGSLAPGNYYFIATYSGDTSYPSIVGSPEPFSIATALSHVTVSPSSSCALTGVSATVSGSSGTPTGSVVFSLYNSANALQTTYASVPLINGVATLPSATIGTLSSGGYYFLATYSGDGNYSSSTGTGTFTVTSCTVTVSTTPTLSGASATDKVTVTGSTATPGGSVTWTLWSGTYPGTQVIGYSDTVTLSGAGASVSETSTSTGTLSPGNYYFIATYSGDGNYPAVTGLPEPFTIASATPLVTVTPSSSCSVTGVSATVSGSLGTPTGSVVFSLYNSANVLQTTYPSVTLVNGVASLSSATVGTLSSGNYYFVATYSGDSNYSGTTGTGSFSVTSCTVSVSTTPTLTGTSATDTVTVTGNTVTPTGTVAFTLWSGTYPGGTQITGYVDSETLSGAGTTATGTTATATGSLAPGNYYFIATYSGDSNYPSVIGLPEPFSIAAGSINVSTTPSINGTSATDTVTVTGTTGTPSGHVTFTLWSGSYPGTLVASYSDTETLSGAGTTTTATTSTPTGALAAGSYYFVATYTPDGAASAFYTSATVTGSPEVLVVTTTTPPPGGGGGPPPPPVSLSLTTNPTVSGSTAIDTATISGSGAAPTGTITFTIYSGTFPNGTLVSAFTPDQVTLSGSSVSSVTTGTLPAGSYYFLASYSGDTTYAAVTPGTPEPFTIAAPAAPAGVVSNPNPSYKIPNAAPQTGAGGMALTTFNGGLLTLGALMLLAGLSAMALLFRRRRHA